MNVMDAIRSRRSIRKFQDRKISQEQLARIMEAAQYYPCAANLQPLQFLVVTDCSLCNEIFSSLKWAGYLKNYQMERAHRPTAYLVLIGDMQISNHFEFCAGAAVAELMLAAQAEGIASCCLQPAEKNRLYPVLGLNPDRQELLYVIALGYAAQESNVIPMETGCRYYLDENGGFVVPKRSLEDTVFYL